jgi:hypothetical protein
LKLDIAFVNSRNCEFGRNFAARPIIGPVVRRSGPLVYNWSRTLERGRRSAKAQRAPRRGSEPAEIRFETLLTRSFSLRIVDIIVPRGISGCLSLIFLYVHPVDFSSQSRDRS